MSMPMPCEQAHLLRFSIHSVYYVVTLVDVRFIISNRNIFTCAHYWFLTENAAKYKRIEAEMLVPIDHP